MLNPPAWKWRIFQSNSSVSHSVNSSKHTHTLTAGSAFKETKTSLGIRHEERLSPRLTSEKHGRTKIKSNRTWSPKLMAAHLGTAQWTPPAPGCGLCVSARRGICSGSTVVWTWGWRETERRETRQREMKQTDTPEWERSSDRRARAASQTRSRTRSTAGTRVRAGVDRV